MSKITVDNNLVSFRALQLANEHRNAYGLRYNDFTRYRKHCGNRTHRLRSSLKMTHGKGRDFKKLPPITLENIKAGHLELLLFETERAWAYSQELYTSSLQPANKENAAKLRHSATGRFRRALHWCTQLLSHCQSLHAAARLSASHLLEINAYTLVLSGRFLRYKDEFEDALDQLCVARDLLDLLAECAESSRDQALATLFADEVAPEIRYCAHQLGQKNSYDIERIVKEVAPKHREALVDGYSQLVERLRTEGRGDSAVQSRKRLQPLVWEGQPVPVRNPELVDVLLEVQKAETLLRAKDDTDEVKVDRQGEKKPHAKKRYQKSTRKGVAAFDAILAALSDAEEVSRKLAEAQKATGSSSLSTADSRDIHFLHTYIVYQLLSRRVERDLTLVAALLASSQGSGSGSRNATKSDTASKSKPNTAKLNDENPHDARVNPALVKLLDTVVQSLNHMRSLSIVDDAPDLASAVDARLAYTKARRCVYLARSYAAVKQYAQALALNQRSLLSNRDASSLLSSQAPSSSSSSPSTSGADPSSSSFYPLSLQDTSSLDALLTADSTRFARDWFAHNGGAISAEKDTSKKPLFFDIALNYVQLDMERLHLRAEGESTEVKKKMKKTKVVEPRAVPVVKAKMEEVERAGTPELKTTEASRATGGLSSLLGGWWGRK